MEAVGSSLLTLLLLFLLLVQAHIVVGTRDQEQPQPRLTSIFKPQREHSSSPSNIQKRAITIFNPWKVLVASVQKQGKSKPVDNSTPKPSTERPVPSTTTKPPVTLICYSTNGTHYTPYHIPDPNNYEHDEQVTFVLKKNAGFQSVEPITFYPANALICYPEEYASYYQTKPNTFLVTVPPSIQPTEPFPLLPTEPTQPEEFPVCDYFEIHPQHSMTLEPNAECNIRRAGILQEEKEEIVRLHNVFRAKVSRGDEHRGRPGPQLQAANMCVLHWNEELAAVAQAWANQCRYAYDGFERRKLCSRDYVVGQNVYYHTGTDSTSNWAEAIQSWYDEVEDFPRANALSFHADNSSRRIHHYSQMVWGVTREVGCGAVYYSQAGSSLGRVYVCNYGPSGNSLGSPVYQVGLPGKACGFAIPSDVYPELCEWNQNYGRIG
ncbi:uncharacterized protein [Procambarus clarkii]|uniref:uncharacterized protein n=1 Tax=Procambarus clarkii TaxID=6728 RepID=UPI001E670D20|nr:CRISP/Allergen/PR-1-like [Procambarus clarkii]